MRCYFLTLCLGIAYHVLQNIWVFSQTHTPCFSLNYCLFFSYHIIVMDCYRSRGPEFDSRRYQIFWQVVGLERFLLSLVSTTEELLARKSTGSGLENGDYGRRGSATLTTRRSLGWYVSLADKSHGVVIIVMSYWTPVRLESAGSRLQRTELFRFQVTLPAREERSEACLSVIGALMTVFVLPVEQWDCCAR
jgi:hypothetical protein